MYGRMYNGEFEIDKRGLRQSFDISIRLLKRLELFVKLFARVRSQYSINIDTILLTMLNGMVAPNFGIREITNLTK